MEIGRDLHLNSIGFQFGSKFTQSLQVARAEQHAFHNRRQATGTAGTDIARCSDDEQR